MNALYRLVVRCLLGAAGFVLALLVILAFTVLGAGLYEYNHYPYSDYTAGQVAEALHQTDGGWALDPAHTTEQWLDGYEWAMQLDDSGKIVWQYALPPELDRQYTLSEAAAFSRWYLEDYPVFVWRNDYGLMVLAKAKGSVWRYNYYSTPGAVSAVLTSAGQAVAMVLGAALLLCGGLLWRFWRQLRAIGAGIDALARGQPVSVQAEGVTAGLAQQLNQTGAVLRSQAEALARRDTARTNWVAGVSHDIRTPLALICAYAEQLGPGEPARSIQRQAQKIKALVEDLNLTSRLQYDAQPLRRERLAAGTLLRQAAVDFCNTHPQETYPLTFLLDGDADRAVLEVDRAMLCRALENLLRNAAQHNPQGCAVILQGRLAGNRLLVTVADDGAGYPPGVLAALHSRQTGKESPHILGLHLVEQIAAAHGGSAAFAPNPPRGAKAELTIPLA